MMLAYWLPTNLREAIDNNYLIINELYRFLFSKDQIHRPGDRPCNHKSYASVNDDADSLIFESFASIEKTDIAHRHDDEEIETDHQSIEPGYEPLSFRLITM